MDYLSLDIVSIHQAILEKQVTPLELVEEAIKRAKEDNNNAFEFIDEKRALDKAKELSKQQVPRSNLLFGIPYVLKNNFSTKGIESNASSNTLKGYIPVFDASVYKILDDHGAIMIGKTSMDELAMGGKGITGHLGPTINPYKNEEKRICGGSSSGSAEAVANNIVPFSIGSDTGDSVRKPASYTGLVGFKPTRGLISRYGLFQFASSLDHVAYFTKYVKDAEILLNVLSKTDDKDFSCFRGDRKKIEIKEADIRKKKICVIQEILDTVIDENIKNKFNKSIDYLKKNGAKVDYISINKKILDAIWPTYFVISSSEATSNSACIDGIKYGLTEPGNTYKEIVVNSRTKGFCFAIKRRFTYGSYFLAPENQDEYFIEAQKIRRLFVNKFNELFDKYDAVYLPASGTIAPKISECSKDFSIYNYVEYWLAIANFGGFPSITIPMGFSDDMPFGFNLTCKQYDEQNLFEIAEYIEKYSGLAGIFAKSGGGK